MTEAIAATSIAALRPANVERGQRRHTTQQGREVVALHLGDVVRLVAASSTLSMRAPRRSRVRMPPAP